MAKKKGAKPTPEFNSERETRVLLEEVRSDVKTVGEQHGAIKEEIKQLRNSMESRFNTVEMAVMENSRQTKELKAGQERIEQKLDTNLADHERRIKKIEEKTIV